MDQYYNINPPQNILGSFGDIWGYLGIIWIMILNRIEHDVFALKHLEATSDGVPSAPHLVQPFFGLRHAGGFVDRELLLQLEMAGKSAYQNWEKHERKSTSKKRITFGGVPPKTEGKPSRNLGVKVEDIPVPDWLTRGCVCVWMCLDGLFEQGKLMRLFLLLCEHIHD